MRSPWPWERGLLTSMADGGSGVKASADANRGCEPLRLHTVEAKASYSATMSSQLLRLQSVPPSDPGRQGRDCGEDDDNEIAAGNWSVR